jgi:hypothetical protein
MQMNKYEYFGETALMNVSDSNFSNVLAETEVKLLVLSNHDFLRKFTVANLKEIEARHSQYETYEELMNSFKSEIEWEKFKKALIQDM